MSKDDWKVQTEQRIALIREERAADPGISERDLSRRLDIPRAWLYKHREEIEAALPQGRAKRDLDVDEIPDGDLDVAQLIDIQTKRFEMKRKEMEARQLTKVRVKIDGPVGITWFGDPHIDDDGCNWPRLRKDIDLVNATEGMYAANIGDGHNNWQGRLARLYGHQGTSEAQAWSLVDWFVRSLPWLIFLDGNHGAWSGAGNPVKWMLKNCHALHDEVDARIELNFPNGMKSTIYARHDFPGHSQWNTIHGLSKAATFGGYDDSLLVAGHKHTSGYAQVKNPKSGVISHLLRVAGYKVIDKYAKDNFFKDARISESAVTIFNPEKPPTDPHHVTVFHDVEEGAKYLKFLRARK